MQVAFYAPLNAPTAPVPSGDRLIARAIWAAIRLAGNDVVLASRLRSLDIGGDEPRQRRLAALGHRLADRLIERYLAMPRERRPDVWLTYHLYHKAPDRIGPAVSRALDIPYAVAEASYAPKRSEGPWAEGLRACAEALGHSDLVLGFKSNDERCVRPLLREEARYLTIRPFLEVAPFAAAAAAREAHRRALAREHGLDLRQAWLLTVGMMRPGPKLRCYLALAESLALLVDRPWQLLVVGGGPEEAPVREALQPFADRVRFLGCRQGDELLATYAAADAFVWPAVNEPIGMVFLEAQAAGVAVVGADRTGVGEVVLDGVTGLLPTEGCARSFAAAIAQLLDDPARRRAMGEAGRRHAIARHDIANAGAEFVAAIGELLRQPASST